MQVRTLPSRRGYNQRQLKTNNQLILTLNTDIPDRKGNFYAKANDKVTLVNSDHYPVLIVKNNTQSFSVRVEYTNYKNTNQ